jgi:hypothetical protein
MAMKRSAMKRSSKPLKRSKRMRRRSKKMEAFYRDVRRPYVEGAVGDGSRPCPVRSPHCTKYVQGVHEKLTRARAGGIIAAHKDGNMMPCCHACNGYISEHPAWAEKKGLLLREG